MRRFRTREGSELGGQAMPAKKRRNFLKKPGFDCWFPGIPQNRSFKGPFCKNNRLKAVWDFIPVCHTCPLQFAPLRKYQMEGSGAPEKIGPRVQHLEKVNR